MASYSRAILSGSPSSGRPIPVGASSTPIHTAAASPSLDEVHLWASNVTATAATLTVEFGGVVNPDDHLVDALSIPPNSAPIPIANGQTLQGGLSVTAFSGTAGAINISGYVNRVSA